MLLGAEIGLFLFGLYALIGGSIPSTRRGAGGPLAVTGWRARVVGLIALSAIPLAVALLLAVGVGYSVAHGTEMTEDQLKQSALPIEVSSVVFAAVLATVVERTFSRAQERQRDRLADGPSSALDEYRSPRL